MNAAPVGLTRHSRTSVLAAAAAPPHVLALAPEAHMSLLNASTPRGSAGAAKLGNAESTASRPSPAAAVPASASGKRCSNTACEA